MNWIYVMAGGAAGCALRYAIGLLLASPERFFPWATLAANLIAALVIAFAWNNRCSGWWEGGWLLLATGFCGGLSTFSAFSLENVQLIREGRAAWALVNILLSVAGCMAVIAWLTHQRR